MKLFQVFSAVFAVSCWVSAAMAAGPCCGRLAAAEQAVQTQRPGCAGAGTPACPRTGRSDCPVVGAKGCPLKDGWPMTLAAWTFHKETLFDAIDNAQKLGIRYIELIPSHVVSPEMGDSRFDVNASVALIAKIKTKMERAGVRPLAMYTNGLNSDEAQCRRVFDFAKVMGIITINGEPPMDALPLVDKLANEYGINVAVHNHPRPSTYWNPEIVLEAIKDCSPRIGVCADTGHWIRSGLDPVECLKKLEGRVYWVHFKDLNEVSREAHDVVWGTGEADAGGILAELKRQNYVGGIAIEYEHNWGHAMPELGQCVAFYRRTVDALFGAVQEP